MTTITRWMIQKRYGPKNIDGAHENLTFDFDWYNETLNLWHTKRTCKEAIEKKYGYYRDYPDLREHPHDWRMPVPVRVTITFEETPCRPKLTRRSSTTSRASSRSATRSKK